MDNETKEIIENALRQIIDELRDIHNTIITGSQQINDKLDAIYEHVYYIHKNTS